ncbi:lipopolysaccharide biosynthesis protein [Croceicoccus naphthovorans]|nr:lipopolysaccharide biosynthesis protein [Croceicoccus naphthovorans]MBB3990923.1 O-antigen/teichoic acid export membrane protein [Croceicoccus naphthovorans]
MGRMVANLAWLIAGKGFGAVCSLVYLAILTRTLGLKDFGHFALIFGTSQALIAICGFETWRVVVRYGAEHVHAKNWDAFGRLSMLAGVLDVVGALFGTLVAYLAFYQFADMLELNPALVDMGFWFNVAAVWALVSAPTGVVRALDRFDLAVYVEALVPLGRLAAAVGIWLTGPSLVKFFIAWALIDLLEAAVYWIIARWLCPQAIRFKNLRSIGQTKQENTGVVRFFGVTYASASLNALYRHGPLLAVGYFVGTSSAGLYRLAHQLAQGLAKLSTLLTRAAYAEIARARVASDIAAFRKLVVQTTRLAGLGGLLVVAVVFVAGRFLLELIAGESFGAAYVALVPLTIAASFELASVAFEPVLHSTNRARLALRAHFAIVVATSAMLLLLAPTYGSSGAAWSVAIGGLVGYLVMGGMTLYAIRRLES